MKEVWKDIKGYEGLYQASNLGRIKSLTRYKKILKPVKNKNGYLYNTLTKDKVSKQYRLHVIIAQTFIPNPDNLPQVNHKSGVKTDNRVCNLEYCTCKDNIRHAYKVGLSKGRKNELNCLSKKVIQSNINGEKIKVWESTMQIQRELGINNNSISQCCLGKIKKSHGYKWNYL